MGVLCSYSPQQSLYFSPLPHGHGSSAFGVFFFFGPHPHDNTIRLQVETMDL